jgi:putative hemolysin
MSNSVVQNKSKGPKLIDIEGVFASKNPKLLKLIPSFIMRYLKRTIHQEEINQFLIQNHHLHGLNFAEAILKLFSAQVEWRNLENIPSNSRYLFVANHPLGGLDGIAFIHAIGSRFEQVKFPVNDILMNLENLHEIFIPINKHGGHSRQAAKLMDEAFSSSAQMLYFPAGLVSRKINGKITDLEWKSTFIKKAISYQRNVVPVHISGQNSSFFYGLANFRKRIGLKANIEMLYLPDEMFKQNGKKIVITFGTPISWEQLKESQKPDTWASEIKAQCYRLAE